MADVLTQFLKEQSRKSFKYGEQDCFTLPADWVLQQRGFDAANEWRGRYCSAFSAARILLDRGGMISHYEQCYRQLTETFEPKRGDLAVAAAPEGLVGVILTGGLEDYAVYRALHGVMFRRMHLLQVWAV